MKVLMLNGSPHREGAVALALREMENVFHAEGVETEILQVGSANISGCKACEWCGTHGRCVTDDLVNVAAEKFRSADGLVLASPVYYASANGTLISLLDRLFYSMDFDPSMKVGASVACARRGGITATFDELNKYFTISRMPVASGQYWNGIHGNCAEEAAQDAEGRQMMRTLARNMVFLMKSVALGKERFGLPPREEKREVTNFIR